MAARSSLAAVNAGTSVLAGPQEAIAGLEAELRERGVECHRLHTSYAFHPMMEPALGPFGERCQHVRLQRGRCIVGSIPTEAERFSHLPNRSNRVCTPLSQT